MSKITEVRLSIRQGLPNYSSREASVVVVADEAESLDVVKKLQEVKTQIESALQASGTVPRIEVSTPEPAKPAEASKEKPKTASLPAGHVEKLKAGPAKEISAAAKSILDD